MEKQNRENPMDSEGKILFPVTVTRDLVNKWKKVASEKGFPHLSAYIQHTINENIFNDFPTKLEIDGLKSEIDKLKTQNEELKNIIVKLHGNKDLIGLRTLAMIDEGLISEKDIDGMYKESLTEEKYLNELDNVWKRLPPKARTEYHRIMKDGKKDSLTIAKELAMKYAK